MLVAKEAGYPPQPRQHKPIQNCAASPRLPKACLWYGAACLFLLNFGWSISPKKPLSQIELFLTWCFSNFYRHMKHLKDFVKMQILSHPVCKGTQVSAFLTSSRCWNRDCTLSNKHVLRNILRDMVVFSISHLPPPHQSINPHSNLLKYSCVYSSFCVLEN